MLRSDWFEQAITEYGMQTGVTAVGLMLLRVVDPQTRTTAAEAFASKQMVFAPLFGGGLVTATVPLLLLSFGLGPVLGGSVALFLAFYLWPARRGGGEGA
jgi:ESS family glutamate:Na+ symporter